jgi:hypothetical protein
VLRMETDAMDCDHWAEGAHCLMASFPKRRQALKTIDAHWHVLETCPTESLGEVRYGLVKVTVEMGSRMIATSSIGRF